MRHPTTPETPVNQGQSARRHYVGALSGGPAASEGMAFRMASWRIGDVIAAHDFDKRESFVLHLIRWYSFGALKTEAEFPTQSFFVKALRTTKGNVSAILTGLKNKLVIEEWPAGFYGFVLPWQHWKVARRVSEVEVIRQLELFERPAHLGSAMREVFVEQSGAKSDGINSRSAVSGSSESGVPESGTPDRISAVIHSHEFPNREPSEFVKVEKPSKSGVWEGVPESGTEPLVSINRSTDFKQYCLRNKTRGRKFSEAEQETWNRLISIGARHGTEPFRNLLDRNFFISFVRHNRRELDALMDDLKNEEATRKKESPIAWIRARWNERGRPGDWH